MKHNLQRQRYELKYMIGREQVVPIRDFVSSYLVADGFASPEDFAYDIHSIYLDSDGMETYYSAINGDKNRYKLRLRFYNDDPASPIFFEFKRCMNNIVLKSRCAVKRAAVADLMAGHLPDPALVVSHDARDQHDLAEFCRIMQQINATPKSHVAYRREAWISEHDNSVRVTMDSEVRAEPQFDVDFRTRMDSPVYVFGSQLVLELKFTDRFPNWFRELVSVFGLMQCGGAKYVGGIELGGLESFTRHEGGSAKQPPNAYA